MFFPGETSSGAASVLYVSGAQVLAGLAGGWALRLRASTLALVDLYLTITIVFVAAVFALEYLSAPRSDQAFMAWLGTIPFLAVIGFVWCRYRAQHKLRRLAAILLFLFVNGAGAAFGQSDRWFWHASMEARSRLHLAPPKPDDSPLEAMRAIPPDRLWGAQEGLVKAATDALRPRTGGRSNVYAIAVAAAGSQQLFAREARLALGVAAARYGDGYRGGVLLSNGLADILHAPLATQTNMLAAAGGIAARIDRTHDVAFVYLASHGSRDAELETDLPSYDDLTAISAVSVANALAKAGITRRVIVISACFAGSWIPTLATDDTIVIAAARRDRTSFGCDDTRRLTYFGQAFLQGPLSHGASLRDAFETARRTVAGWEAKEKLTPSDPQVFVGKNMQALWNERAPPTTRH